MAMTEPHCGSDTAAIRTTAVRTGEHWVLNGEKIFVTSGHKALVDSQGLVVVWATIDPRAGRAGIKPFVVEAGTLGLRVTKLEKKLGIRASDTASVVLEDCRVPLGNLLGTEQVADPGQGFKGAMATFDATRPAVAASALGIARATIEMVKELLVLHGIEVRYDRPRNLLSAVERDLLDMEAQLRATWLLTLKAAWMMDREKPNTLESSMCKVKAGDVVTRITQKGVELLGPPGYSRRLLLEKWMRDAKINDLFEGTGQINRLVIARRILGYTSRELK
jgi:acyl-CoA dehydrogenase